jgi:hypothetical protein
MLISRNFNNRRSGRLSTGGVIFSLLIGRWNTSQVIHRHDLFKPKKTGVMSRLAGGRQTVVVAPVSPPSPADPTAPAPAMRCCVRSTCVCVYV